MCGTGQTGEGERFYHRLKFKIQYEIRIILVVVLGNEMRTLTVHSIQSNEWNPFAD